VAVEAVEVVGNNKIAKAIKFDLMAFAKKL
jgi:hypothetical protein